MIRHLCTVVALSLLAALPASAQYVIDNPPGREMCQSSDHRSQRRQSFQLTTKAVVSHITWWGAYQPRTHQSANQGGGMDHFTIEIYSLGAASRNRTNDRAPLARYEVAFQQRDRRLSGHPVLLSVPREEWQEFVYRIKLPKPLVLEGRKPSSDQFAGRYFLTIYGTNSHFSSTSPSTSLAWCWQTHRLTDIHDLRLSPFEILGLEPGSMAFRLERVGAHLKPRKLER